MEKFKFNDLHMCCEELHMVKLTVQIVAYNEFNRIILHWPYVGVNLSIVSNQIGTEHEIN